VREAATGGNTPCWENDGKVGLSLSGGTKEFREKGRRNRRGCNTPKELDSEKNQHRQTRKEREKYPSFIKKKCGLGGTGLQTNRRQKKKKKV